MITSQGLRVGALASVAVFWVACSHTTERAVETPEPAPKETAAHWGAPEAIPSEVGAERGEVERAAGQSPTPAQQSPGAERIYVFECGNQRDVIVRANDSFAYLISENYTALPRTEITGATRETYQLGNAKLALSGEHALLELGNGERLSCRNNEQRATWEDARQRGVTFRGVGSSPTFLLEIDKDNVTVLTGDGQNRYVFTRPAPDVKGAKTTYHGYAGQSNVTAILEEGRCRDAVTGQEFNSRVRVDVDSQTYEGCGRSLE